MQIKDTMKKGVLKDWIVLKITRRLSMAQKLFTVG